MRKVKFLLLFICLFLSAAAFAQDGFKPAWTQWKNQFVDSSGRIIDTGQQKISHSEGQGIGLILAASAKDQTSFIRIWTWTHEHLQQRQDALFSWRWEPATQKLGDVNNASDGDMLIAWGLIMGADNFGQPQWRNEAKKILLDVRLKLLRTKDNQTVILPGNAGFEFPNGKVLNLSYWLFPAFDSFNKADPAAEWDQLRNTGLSYLDRARFGRWNLPPDWLFDDGKTLTLALNQPANFGYDAVRIPLYLKWAGLATPERLKPYTAFWHYFDGAQFVPAWTNLQNNSVDSYNAAPGIIAIQNWILGKPLPSPAPLNNEDYYSASLKMLVWLAAHNPVHP